MLSCPSTPASLFPTLCKLTWRADGTHIFAEFLRMALVPSMLVLHVEISSASSAFLSVLSSLGTLCPHLENTTMRIQCETFELSRKISPFITQSISQLHHLHTLSVLDLGCQGIEHVMQLRALQSLSLDLRVSSAWDKKLLLQLPGFHNLKWLGLSTGTIEHASNFFNSLQVISSKQIEVSFMSLIAKSPASAYSTLSQFFAIFQDKCDNDKLQYLSLVQYTGNTRAGLDILTSLHAFPNLTHLLLSGVCNISMSDEELCQLVRAWPKLQVLKFSGYSATDTAIGPKATFHGLIELLRLCPALTSLSLVIDTTKVDGIDLKYPSGRSRNKHLKFLTLGLSSIKSPLNVALILSGLFPCLEQVYISWWEMLMPSSSQNKSTMEQWQLVNSFLAGFNVVRERGKDDS
ncbi:hypothetical protein EDB19DRAFT_1670354 [Suillus lakei]|nr:hypothetical protein EDB19DRAFT_1670354 [Suillus lakei]